LNNQNGNILHHEQFPLSNKYDQTWVMYNEMGPHPLWLTEFLTQSLDLKPGMRVLDLACGKGMTSVFLAREFGVQVYAVDFDEWEGWTSTESRWNNAQEHGVEHLIIPVKADARSLPFAQGFFDAIVCINAYFYFGADDVYLENITKFLRPGGQLGIVVPGYMKDISNGIPDYMKELDDGSCTWQTLAWWKRLWEKDGLVSIDVADTLPSGCALWLRYGEALHASGHNKFDDAPHVFKQDLENGEYIGFVRLVATRPDTKALKIALGKVFGTTVKNVMCKIKPLHGGTVGNVQLLSGIAETTRGEKLPYQIVLKTQEQWSRYNDPLSWRREYDLFVSDLDDYFTETLRWPTVYHMEISDNEHRLWMEYIDGVTGIDMTPDMYERAAYELGRLQGKLYAEKPTVLDAIDNLSSVDAMKKFYLHYKSWNIVYDYVRSADCKIPTHLCNMIIEMDSHATDIFSKVEKLPVVLCHRDFWITNILCKNDEIVLIDWDTTGWGYLGEDLTSLIADEADVENMFIYYQQCTTAYRRGFSKYADISHISNMYIYERIVLHFGYRLVEWYLDAKTDDVKDLHIQTLQKIYDMGGIKL